MLSSTSIQTNRNDPVHNASRQAPPRVTRSTVLHLTPDLDIGTSSREVVDLAIQTHRLGWRPVVVSSGGALVLEAERAAVRHAKMPIHRTNAVTLRMNRLRLESLVKREMPGLVHVHGLSLLPNVINIVKSHNLPLLIDIVDPLPLTRANSKLLQLAQARQAWFRVPSTFMAQHLRNEHKLTTDRLYHVSPGVDLVWFDPSRVSPERLQKMADLWRLPEQAAILVMATPLAPGYGHRQLLEALSRLKHLDVFTVIVGNDKKSPGMRQEIEKMIRTFGLEGKVVMPEHCTDWPAGCWLSTAMVATNVFPRGQAMELLEAQAIGRPIIATDTGTNREIVASGETAWLVPPDNVDVLTEALHEAISMTGSQRIDLAIRTRHFITDHFPSDRWSGSMAELYAIMIGQPITAQKSEAA